MSSMELSTNRNSKIICFPSSSVYSKFVTCNHTELCIHWVCFTRNGFHLEYFYFFVPFLANDHHYTDEHITFRYIKNPKIAPDTYRTVFYYIKEVIWK